MSEKKFPALDAFRIPAAVLVIAIHTSPLASVSDLGDFWFTRVLARVAVPFFFMMTGHFLGQTPRRFWQRTLLLYAGAALLYLPLNWYAGTFSALDWMRKFLLEGTFYHLWYFPAVLLGVPLVCLLRKLGTIPAFCAAGLLYLIGLGGDSYYGFLADFPAVHAFYKGVFTLFGYTRNGLFFAPLFLLLGMFCPKLNRKTGAVGFVVSLTAMSVEALWLHGLGVQRHDSMYLLLPVCMLFLFGTLLAWNRGQSRPMRTCSMWVYIIHPWCIVAVRGAAKLCGVQVLLVENSLVHFSAVALLSFAGAVCMMRLKPRSIPCGARAWREIDGEALVHNVCALEEQAGSAVMAVVKADGYGHGAVLVARTLQKAGVTGWAVACLSEGIALRRAGIRGRILILGYTDPAQAPLLARWRLTQTVVDEAHAAALSASGWPVRAHLALDTGMHRLGVPAQDLPAIRRIFHMPGLRIVGVFSHLCAADGTTAPEQMYTEQQTNLFWKTIQQLRREGIDPGEVHLQASYGILNQPAISCSWVRAGIALYGVYSGTFAGKNPVPLCPVLTLRARVATVRCLQPGDVAGYGLAFEAERKTILATVTIGYADGIPRILPQRGGRVLVRGEYAPMVGRLCMDQMLVDVTGIPGVCTGDVVTLIGKDGAKEIRTEELACRCGTITNEILSGLSPRLGLCLKKRGRHKIRAKSL